MLFMVSLEVNQASSLLSSRTAAQPSLHTLVVSPTCALTLAECCDRKWPDQAAIAHTFAYVTSLVPDLDKPSCASSVHGPWPAWCPFALGPCETYLRVPGAWPSASACCKQSPSLGEQSHLETPMGPEPTASSRRALCALSGGLLAAGLRHPAAHAAHEDIGREHLVWQRVVGEW